MEKLFIVILEITDYGIKEVTNKVIDLNEDSHAYEGIKFKILYVGDVFCQILIYTYNQFTTQVLGPDGHSIGKRERLGVKLDSPVLIETDEGFAGVLCSYVFQISRQPIQIHYLYQMLGVNKAWKPTADSYQKFRERFFCSKVNEFSEMMHYIDYDSSLYDVTEKMVKSTILYKENFVSNRSPQKDGFVSFQENLTLRAAESFVDRQKHVAILNFANPIEPGGGVLRGAEAQEEYLCRTSNLYKALISENAKEYYYLNYEIKNENQFNSIYLGTDMVLYSPDVMVLKGDAGYKPFFGGGEEKYMDIPYNVDVLTCAAPFFSGLGYILADGDLEHLLKRRIRNIFEVAIENNVEVLILGAFGCGAFHNPPQVVAKAFRNVLLEKRYMKAFDSVVFAVKRSESVCPNIEAFEKYFTLFPDINDNGIEKEHRLSWKWECLCGMTNNWEKTECEKCRNNRKNRVIVKMKN